MEKFLKILHTCRRSFRLVCFGICVCMLTLSMVHFPAWADEKETVKLQYARAAVVIDAENGRMLSGYHENEELPMASTTKIMTLLIALTYGNPEDTVTISSYAAAQPDVQMNAQKGEQYRLEDLLYGMMLRSYNDVAVAIAEYVADVVCDGGQDAETVVGRTQEESKERVAYFASIMNEKARSLGCTHTYFITPNGLDAEDENGIHHTTAYELALIAAEAIRDERVVEITTTRSYYIKELNGKRAVDVTTTDKFLDMMPNAVGLKTGFTGNAGYCFVGAIQEEDRSFVSVVLGCGWPPNKTYKWVDTKALMNYAKSNYFESVVLKAGTLPALEVLNGQQESAALSDYPEVSMLLSDDDSVQIGYNIPENIEAPVIKGEQIGNIEIIINGEIQETIPVCVTESVKRVDFLWFLHQFLEQYFL